VYFEKEMRQNCLRWFGHIQRRAINAPVKKNELFQVERTKKVRKTKSNIIEVVKKDMTIMKITESMASDSTK
jgi:hypothetical protein